jgi:hypothetical protein
MHRTATNPAERLMRHVAISANGCWDFTGRLTMDGYGELVDVRSGARRTVRAHRLSFETNCGPIPDGLHVLHRCDNRKCVNPAHLYCGTNSDNIRDRVARHRSARNVGQLNGRSKITANIASDIRARAASGESRASIARSIGVSKAQITRIVNNKQWVV